MISPSSSICRLLRFLSASSAARPSRSVALMAPRRRPGIAVLVLVELLLLLLVSPALGNSEDKACLSNLRRGLTDPGGGLHNWTAGNLAAPCNEFTSYMHGVTCNNGRVYKLALSGLALGGGISPFVANCSNLQSLDLSANQIAGPIPAELSALLNLAVLNLSSNRLAGPIPPQLVLCAYLNVIDLHGNQLSGPIPDQLGLLARLSTFDVSYNRLEGLIPVLLANRSGPAAALPRFNESSFIGNRGLYGYPLPPARSRGLSVLSIVAIGLGSGLLSLVLSFTAVCIWLRVTERAATADGEEGKISNLMPEY